MPRVSIIVPVYNAEAFIVGCVDSVLSQTEEEWELILVNDCSTDNTEQVIDCLLNNNCKEKISVLKQEHNQGPSAARNRGIREAKGEYLFFLDADDTITPDCIEQLYDFAKKYDADFVQGSYCGNKNNNVAPDLRYTSEKKRIKRTLLNHNIIPFAPHNKLVRRQMVLDNSLFFNEEIKVREDFLWMTFVAKYVERFAYCDQPTYNRGFNAESLTNNINVEREILGYRVLIETMVANYDAFLLGNQKELALEALVMALREGYYHDEVERKHLINVVASKNNCLENLLLKVYLKMENSKILHLLVKIYKR